jgi:hypothetical protein
MHITDQHAGATSRFIWPPVIAPMATPISGGSSGGTVKLAHALAVKPAKLMDSIP